MKPLLTILLLTTYCLLLTCTATLAQHPSIPADVRAYTMDKQRALTVYRGDDLRDGDLLPFTSDADTSNRIGIVIQGVITRVKLLDGIEMTGLVAGRRIVPETCFGSKGEDCQRIPHLK